MLKTSVGPLGQAVMTRRNNVVDGAVIAGRQHESRSLMASPYGSSLSAAADDGAIMVLRRKRRRTRSVLLLSGLFFLVAIVLDGILQLYSYSPQLDEEQYHDHHFIDGVNSAGEAQSFIGGDNVARGLLRRLLGLDKGSFSSHATTRMVRRGVIPHDTNNESNFDEQPQLQQQQQQQLVRSVSIKSSHIKLHTFPLLPAHVLRHRRRRELMDRKLPIPESLRLPEQRQRTDHETTSTTTASSRRRTREYDVPNEVISIPTSWSTPGLTRTLYNTGALYQGYGTHYIDLWIGSPTPQRQTLIVDTGSSITAFPCSGCDDCGNSASASTAASSSSSSLAQQQQQQQQQKSYHTDDVYQTKDSTTYIEKECTRDPHLLKKDVCDYGYCIKVPGTDGSDANVGRCEVKTSYAEGSSWTALEVEDVVYPAVSLGVGEGSSSSSSMGDVEVDNGTNGIPQWLDFRLKFGCQEKVSLC